MNQTTGSASLDYTVHRETGLRVIAVGGNSLSRGLTLEGLCTSYFYRNSQMYDTLLQMGRWYGYRDGYEDVCRLWLSGEAQHWYGHITEATEVLRAEIHRMHSHGMTPQEFGLKVRAHPDSLIVTARNKMARGQDGGERVGAVDDAVEQLTVVRHVSAGFQLPEVLAARLAQMAFDRRRVLAADQPLV